jgi:hypothetical protein
MSDDTGRIGREPRERRHNHHLRSLFDTAFALVEPFFASETGWNGQSLEHLTARVVRENFTELSGAEVHSIVVSAHRVYIARHPDASDHLPRPTELRKANMIFCPPRGEDPNGAND